jgi:hypothetical protein
VPIDFSAIVQPTRVVNVKLYVYDVLIDRSTKWGNPYTHLKGSTRARYVCSTRKQAVEMYLDWLRTQPALSALIEPELKGKTLGCWCKPLACHGDILAAIADGRLKL